jgi:hypothetical protein
MWCIGSTVAALIARTSLVVNTSPGRRVLTICSCHPLVLMGGRRRLTGQISDVRMRMLIARLGRRR